MKKLIFFVLFAGLAAFYGFSQSISLADSLGPVANNTTLVKTGTPSDIEIVSHVFVKNNTAAPMDIKVKKVELSVIPGSMNTFCWGLCFAPSVFISPSPLTIAANFTDSLNFSGHYTPMEISGILHMRYVFFNVANPNDSAWVNVDFVAYPVGIESLAKKSELSNAYPNPANERASFSYSLPEGTNGSVIFRNVLGSVVKEEGLAGNQGKVSVATDNLQNGIYFYSLIVDGKNLLTRKLIVRH